MFIKREHWKTETIIKGVSKIPIYQAHFMIWMAALSGIFFLVGLSQAAQIKKEDFDKIPAAVLLMGLGCASFTLFFPLPYIIYLAKELQKTKERVEELASTKTNDPRRELP